MRQQCAHLAPRPTLIPHHPIGPVSHLPCATQGESAVNAQVSQLQGELRESRQREEAATQEAARAAEEAERLRSELAAAASKANLLQVARNQLQSKVRLTIGRAWLLQ